MVCVSKIEVNSVRSMKSLESLEEVLTTELRRVDKQDWVETLPEDITHVFVLVTFADPTIWYHHR